MWQKIKNWFFYAALAAGAVLAYLGFVRKSKVELPERPTRFPGGDDKPKIPDAPKETDWNKKIDEKFDKIVKESEKSDNNQEVVDSINEKYNGEDK